MAGSESGWISEVWRDSELRCTLYEMARTANQEQLQAAIDSARETGWKSFEEDENVQP